MFEEELASTPKFQHLSLRSEFRAIQILNAAGSIFQVNPEEIRSGSQSEHVVRARWAASFLMREELKPSFPWIGRVIRKHHTTVIDGWVKINEALRRRDPLAEKIRLARALYPNMPGDRLITVRQPNVPLPRILEVVAALLMIKPEDIYRESNLKATVFSRQIATYLLREIGGWELPAIAHHFSQSITTTRYSHHKIEAAVRNDNSIRYIVTEARTHCLNNTKPE